MKKYMFIFLSMLTLSSCGVLDVDFKMLANRFDTPETSGRTLGCEVTVGYAQSSKITLLEVKQDALLSSNVDIDSDPEIDNSAILGLDLGIGIYDWVDFYVRTNQFDGPVIYGVKFQIIYR